MRVPHVLALVGLRCAGKTSAGRLAAARAGVPFHDLDAEIAARRAPGALRAPSVQSATTAGEILAELGEPAFRGFEAEALEALVDLVGPRVLACGGGVVERASNRELLAREALVVWLDAPDAVLATRLTAARHERPPLVPGAPPDQEIAILRARRAPLYAGLAGERLALSGREAPEEVAELVLRAALRRGWPAPRGGGP
jgi:shikimate kinase/3-dehydroquinate synthase